MQINIKATAMELTPAIHDYVTQKLNSCRKFIKSGSDNEIIFNVEVGKTTKHHKEGDLFLAEINLDFEGNNLRVVRTEEDLYAAIDVAKDELVEQITTLNKKKNTLVKKGGRTLKNILKGIGRGFRRNR